MGVIWDKADVERAVSSILGLLSFVFFVNNLPNYIDNCTLVVYAIDTLLMISHPNVNTIQQHLGESLWECF